MIKTEAKEMAQINKEDAVRYIPEESDCDTCKWARTFAGEVEGIQNGKHYVVRHRICVEHCVSICFNGRNGCKEYSPRPQKKGS